MSGELIGSAARLESVFAGQHGLFKPDVAAKGRFNCQTLSLRAEVKNPSRKLESYLRANFFGEIGGKNLQLAL
jgi:hypothetical protein